MMCVILASFQYNYYVHCGTVMGVRLIEGYMETTNIRTNAAVVEEITPVAVQCSLACMWEKRLWEEHPGYCSPVTS